MWLVSPELAFRVLQRSICLLLASSFRFCNIAKHELYFNTISAIGRIFLRQLRSGDLPSILSRSAF